MEAASVRAPTTLYGVVRMVIGFSEVFSATVSYIITQNYENMPRQYTVNFSAIQIKIYIFLHKT